MEEVTEVKDVEEVKEVKEKAGASLYLATRLLGKSLRSRTESGSTRSFLRKGDQAARRARCHRTGPSLHTILQAAALHLDELH